MTIDSAKDVFLSSLIEVSDLTQQHLSDAYDAGAKAEADKWRPVLAEVLREAIAWIDDGHGITPQEIHDYTGWAEKAQALIDGENSGN